MDVGEVLDFVASSLDQHKHKAHTKRAVMASKTVVVDLNRGEKLDGKNYNIWHRKIQYLLDKLEVLETLTNSMEEPEQGNSAQNRRDLEAYQSWRKKDRCARFTMLSSMHNDLIGKFESYGTAQDMWIALKAKFGGTTEHLRKMSAIVRELKVAGNNLTDEQQIQAVIRSLPDSWEQMKLNMTHNESIQTLKDLSRHLKLEAERRVAQGQSSAFFAKHGQHQAFKAKCKSYEKAPQRARGSLQLQRAISGSSRAPPVKPEPRSENNPLVAQAFRQHQDHRNPTSGATSTTRAKTGRQNKAVLRFFYNLSTDVVALARRIFLAHNKLIREPGHVGKKTCSCTVWNSRIAKTFPGLAGILTGKMPSDGPKTLPTTSVRGTISLRP
uniref:Retrotransposon Copia-like N-terminal domain-containing protein n=1 Tax=Fagus sylvatica TaxID=28930 RepID=A0A2N9EHY7_FAGSY